MAEFGGGPATDRAWLREVFAKHLAAWRSEHPRKAPRDSRVTRYFEEFLPARQGRNLVPGLASLTADFTISVPGAGRWRLRLEQGCLGVVEPVAQPGPFDYEIDAPAFLEVAAGRVRPSALFFERRVAIRGDVFRAVSTATALEEFFQLYPYAEEIQP